MCGKGPSHYQRVTAYYDWILDRTNDATYCKNPFWKSTITEDSSIPHPTTLRDYPGSEIISNESNLISKNSFCIFFYNLYSLLLFRKLKIIDNIA